MNTHDHLPEVARALLNDAALSSAQGRVLCQRIALTCGESPAALRRMIELYPVTARNAHWYSELLESVLPHWTSTSAERDFLDWLERRTGEAAVLETIEFRRLCGRKPTQELLLSPSQLEAWTHLHRVADLYFAGSWHRHRIIPSFNTLLAAPSGSGKSFLVGAFATTRGLPLMRMAYSNWIVQGARRQPDTVATIVSFVSRNEQCCLFIDEIDKAGTGEAMSDWAAAVAADVYALLDRTLFDSRSEGNERERRELSQKLRRNVLIIVAGTWQSEFRRAGRRMGFAGEGHFNAAEAIAAAHKIPEELLRRVGGNPIFLQPPSTADLRAMAQAEGLESAAKQLGVDLDYEQAAESGDAMRWLGGLRLRLELLRHERAHPHWRAPAPTVFVDASGCREAPLG
jgi:hypothetical protein